MDIFVSVAEVCSQEDAVLLEGRLSPSDRERALGIQSEKRRSEFVSGRMLVQHCLHAVYGDTAAAWAVEVRPEGGLLIKGDAGETKPALSLSHSHGKVVCALAQTPALGVDIEFVQARKHLPQIAEAILHAQELACFAGLDEAGKLTYFYAKWVLKEALGKAMGCGINYPMRDFLLDELRLVEAPPAWVGGPEHWAFSNTLLDGGYSLGLAWQGDSARQISINTVEIRI